MEIFNDIGAEFQFLFSDLNWLFVFFYAILIYGIKYKQEFDWFNDLFDHKKYLKSLKFWIAGIILLLVFCLFHFLESNKTIEASYVSQILRSWLIVIVFNSMFTDEIKKIDKKSH